MREKGLVPTRSKLHNQMQSLHAPTIKGANTQVAGYTHAEGLPISGR